MIGGKTISWSSVHVRPCHRDGPGSLKNECQSKRLMLALTINPHDCDIVVYSGRKSYLGYTSSARSKTTGQMCNHA